MLNGMSGKSGEPAVPLLGLVIKQELIYVPRLAVHLQMIVQVFVPTVLNLSKADRVKCVLPFKKEGFYFNFSLE